MTVPKRQDGLETISEGIALLIDLAEKGEINPWDVKVVEVFDRCLSKLNEARDREQSGDFSDLSHSGQAFLYASMLILLKAESIVLSEPPVNDSTEEEGLEDADNSGGRHLPQHLERQLRRRGVAQLPQKRAVTLPELIEQLQLMKVAMEQTVVAPRRRQTSKMRSEAAQAIFDLAHQENLVETASELERFLGQRNSDIDEGWLDLEQLLELWSYRAFHSPIDSELPVLSSEAHSPNYDRVGVFWALLLLSAQSKVELVQEEFYQDLKIRAL
jgi:segregation and condensation protein A